MNVDVLVIRIYRLDTNLVTFVVIVVHHLNDIFQREIHTHYQMCLRHIAMAICQ